MNQKRKNLILIIVLLVITNLITHYASSGQESILGKKTTVDVASVDGKTFTSNNIYTKWVEEGQSSTAINSLLSNVDEFILNDKYGDDESVDEEVKTQLQQAKDYYESQGQDFSALLEQSGMSEETWTDLIKNQILGEKAAVSYVEELVTKEQVQEAYDADAPKIKSSHILFKVSPDETTSVDELEKEAKAKADEVYKELEKEMKDSDDVEKVFAKFAKKYSEDEDSKDNGGDVGYSNSEDASYQAAIEGLEIGEYSEVTKTTYGYSIILKTDVQEKKSLDEESVYNKYKSQVAEEMITSNPTYKQVALIELRAEYSLKFKDTDLGEQYSALVEQTNSQLEAANAETK